MVVKTFNKHTHTSTVQWPTATSLTTSLTIYCVCFSASNDGDSHEKTSSPKTNV